MPVLSSYRNQSVDLLICTANQLTGFYMRATLAFSWLIKCEKLCKKIKSGIILKENVKNFP